MADTIVELIKEGKDIAVALTDSERVRFEECEITIQQGISDIHKSLMSMGWAITEITERKLIREKYPKWKTDKYFRKIWGISKGRASQLSSGYKAVKLLEEKKFTIVNFLEEKQKNQQNPDTNKCNSCEFKRGMNNRKYKGIKIPGIGQGKCIREGGLCEKVNGSSPPNQPQEIILPVNEAQTRPLTKLKNPDDVVKAWGLVLQWLNEDPPKKLTATLVKKAVKEILGETAKKKKKEIKKAVESTSLLSKSFKYAHQTMLDVIEAEKNTDWSTSKRTEVIKWLEALVKIAKSED